MLDSVQRVILEFFEKTGVFWNSIASFKSPFVILDILIVALIFYWLYVLIRETRAWRISLGLGIILLVMLFAKLLDLRTLNWIFKHFLTALVVAIPVVFQPELRSALEKLGRIRLSEFPQKSKDVERVIDEIVSAVSILAQNKTGALIVLQQRTGLREYIETGVLLNADLSVPLLLNIFQKNAPLHDGAIIVVGNKIKAAGCLLPLAETKTKQTFGARHQAALGLSRETDALIIVVSEENGEISLAKDGKMTSKLSDFDLKKLLLLELKGEE
jgi:diadenylate cyclase|uniref:Diadenylate cyclase n=1 Tax=candidate division CPR3 bacterium TaxID=2268181 RepID=A0A7V3JAP1_UNCC3